MSVNMSESSVDAIFVISLTTTAGLIAVWSAVSPRHRLMRVAGFLGLPLALWVAPAQELAGPVLAGMAVIAVLVTVARFVASAPFGRTYGGVPKLQFGLATLFYATFLATLVLGAASLLAPQFAGRPSKEVMERVVRSLSLSLPIAGAAACARAGNGVGKRVAALLGGCTAGAMGCSLLCLFPETSDAFDSWLNGFDSWSVVLVPCTSGLVTAAIVWARRGSSERPSAPPTKVARLPCLAARVAMITLVALPTSYVYLELARPMALPPVAPAASEGYERLAVVAEQLAKRTPSQKQHDELILEARRCLARRSVMNLDYTVPRQMARLDVVEAEFEAAARTARLSGDLDAALAIYLDILALADQSQRGGVGIDAAFGSDIEKRALDHLVQIGPQLSSVQCGAAVKRLLAYDEEREPIEDLLQRDNLYNILSEGWRGRWRAAVQATHAVFFDHKVTADRFERPRTRDQARLRVLVCDLAIHAFWREHGALPGSLDELAPRFCPIVPSDPNGGPIKYLKRGTDEYRVSATDGLDEIFLAIDRKMGGK
jgi:hypothetical protein